MSDEFVDELEVLKSIYGDEVISYCDGQLCYNSAFFLLSIRIPSQYPSQGLNEVDLVINNKAYDPALVVELDQRCHDICDNSIGDGVIYQIIELYRSELEKETVIAVDQVEDKHESASYHDQISTALEDVSYGTIAQSKLKIVHGDILVERKSSFQAHFAMVSSMDEVKEFRSIVLNDKKIARATHNIFVYRFTTSQGLIFNDHDDDGETAASGRLAEMIRLMNIDGIAVIVSRWFGGVLLGPDRFKFICNCARSLLEEHQLGSARKR